MFVKCVKAWRVKDNKIVEFEYIIIGFISFVCTLSLDL